MKSKLTLQGAFLPSPTPLTPPPILTSAKSFLLLVEGMKCGSLVGEWLLLNQEVKGSHHCGGMYL